MSLADHQERFARSQTVGEVAALKNVTKTYAGRVAVRGVNIDIKRGDFTILTGHNGSGKSTILSMFMGVAHPDDGEVILLGQSLHEISDKKLKKIKQGRVGIGFQSALVERSHTVASVARLTANANNIKVSNIRVRDLAVQFNMVDKLMHETGGLSGGEQMRVSMMRALATNPELILLDEPTGAMEPKGKAEAFRVLREIVNREQATVVMVTHDPDITREYADCEYVMQNGEISDVRRYQYIQAPTVQPAT